MTSTTTRRAMLAGTAALPALALATTTPTLATEAGMAGLAPWSPPLPKASPDAALLGAAERCIAAYKAHTESCDRDSELHESTKPRARHPSVLRVRKSDEEMGLLQGCSGWKWFDHPSMVNPLRDVRWDAVEWERIETEDYYGSIRRWVTPSPEARARADEVIAAFDKWWATIKPLTLEQEEQIESAEERTNEACARAHAAETAVAELPATTLEGAIAKARTLKAVFQGEPLEPGTNFLECELTVSLIKDLLRMSQQEV